MRRRSLEFTRTATTVENGDLVVGPAPDEDLLAASYLHMKGSGVLQTVFHAGVPSLKWFLEWASKPETILMGCWKRLISDVQLGGIGFVNALEKLGDTGKFKAEVGFVFFDSTFTPREKVRCGQLLLVYLFDRYAIDYLFGTTPESNGMAVRYAELMGFKVFGPVPNYTVANDQITGAWISAISREDFERTK